jgi:hypothetical protein
MSPPSSGSKKVPRKKPTESDRKLLHSATSQKRELFISIAVGTSDPN